MMRKACGVLVIVGVMTAAATAWADGGNATAGRSLFATRCAACHDLKPTRKPGPPLAGVYGRRAGAVPTYHYSAALKNASVTWNGLTLDRWLKNPPAYIPGVNMLAQVDREQDRQNLIAYLKTLGTAAAVQNTAPASR